MAATHRSQRLSPMQERFVQEYLVDCNATAAYKRAGYKGQGNVAEVNAHRLLRQAKVAQPCKRPKTPVPNGSS